MAISASRPVDTVRVASLGGRERQLDPQLDPLERPHPLRREVRQPIERGHDDKRVARDDFRHG